LRPGGRTMGKSVARVTKPATIPPLRDGDRMTRDEFWRRYEASPDVTRAELIKGVVHIISRCSPKGKGPAVPPVSNEGHGDPHFDIIQWLGAYSRRTPGVRGSAPSTVFAPSEDAMPEPDALLRILPECGGQTTTDEEGYLYGAPELAVEVSNTTALIDLGPKLEVYQTEGIREYLVWRSRDRAVDWFRLNRSSRYVPLPPDADGVIRSRVFPGLWLDVNALLANDLDKVLAVVQLGLASPEHAAFVEKLRKAAARKKRS
jgi:hypothetical protein